MTYHGALASTNPAYYPLPGRSSWEEDEGPHYSSYTPIIMGGHGHHGEIDPLLIAVGGLLFLPFILLTTILFLYPMRSGAAGRRTSCIGRVIHTEHFLDLLQTVVNCI